MNVVKINFDGALFSKEKKFGIGMVVKDDNGSVLASCTKSLSQAYSAVEIESMTATMALSLPTILVLRKLSWREIRWL